MIPMDRCPGWHRSLLSAHSLYLFCPVMAQLYAIQQRLSRRALQLCRKYLIDVFTYFVSACLNSNVITQNTIFIQHKLLTLYLLVSTALNFCKQYGPRLVPTKRRMRGSITYIQTGSNFNNVLVDEGRKDLNTSKSGPSI